MESHSKTCSKCKEEKPRTEFSKNRNAKDGLQYRCKVCERKYYQENRDRYLEHKKQYYQENREKRSEYNKQYYQENRDRYLEYRKQYHKENREQRLEYNKQYYQENREQRLEYNKQYHKENREKILEYQKQWRQENRGKMAEYNKQWRQENRERLLEHKKQYRQENPEKIAAKNAKRRALKQDGIPDVLRDCPIEKSRLEQIYKLRGLLTKATGVEYHVDHIWPLSKGGPHWSGNLQIITAEENLSKHDTLCEDTARVIQESLDEHLSSRQ